MLVMCLIQRTLFKIRVYLPSIFDAEIHPAVGLNLRKVKASQFFDSPSRYT
jgi:hypothetical protein